MSNFVSKIGNIALDATFFLRFPEFFLPQKEKNWWQVQKEVYKFLAERDFVSIEFLDEATPRTVKANIKNMPFSLVIRKTGLIYLVALVYLLSAGFLFQRYRSPPGCTCTFFLIFGALYFISAAPVISRPLTLHPFCFQLLTKFIYIAAGGLITLVHFAFVFPKPKNIILKYPRIPYVFYGYYLLTVFLYFSGIIAFATTFPFLCFWTVVMIGAFVHSLVKENDTFLKKQIRLSLLAPSIVGSIFILLNLLPGLLGVTPMRFTSFALLSLILPFALPSAIDNFYLYQKRIEMERKTQKEKERIRQELHDTILNNLANISISSETAIRFLEKDTAKVEDRLKTIKELAKDSSRQLRGFLWITNETHGNWEDFCEYLRKYGHELLKHLNIDFELNVSKNILNFSPPSLLTKVCLYQIFREAMTNIVKHSCADTVTVNISCIEKTLLFEIRDNGKGFEIKNVKEGHYGLKNMKKRIEELKGSFTIKSQIGQGTYIKITLPLE